MLGYDPADFENKGYQAFTDLLHPDDHKKAMDAMQRVLRNETGLYQVDYRIRGRNSVYHWYMDRGTVI
ncbi:MAG TPA: PAS domain-containing protein [Spirochaetota bacterium]|nr:PAS domain-containing protein [Spirochaetota bacterium]